MESSAQLTEARSREFAVEYRTLVLFYGGQLTLAGLGMIRRVMPSGAASEVLGVLVSLGVLGSTPALIYFGYRTARAMGSNAPWAWALGMLLPFINIVTLVFLSRRATDICTAAAIPMGFLGPQVAEANHLRPNIGAAQQGDEADER